MELHDVSELYKNLRGTRKVYTKTIEADLTRLGIPINRVANTYVVTTKSDLAKLQEFLKANPKSPNTTSLMTKDWMDAVEARLEAIESALPSSKNR